MNALISPKREHITKISRKKFDFFKINNASVFIKTFVEHTE